MPPHRESTSHTKPDPIQLSLKELGDWVLASAGWSSLLDLCFAEDLGPGGADPTGELMFSRGDRRSVCLVARQGGVLAGAVCIPSIVRRFAGDDEPVNAEVLVEDGSPLIPGQTIARIVGNARAIVRLERTMLNLVSRLSGVATRTADFVRAVDGTDARICDTRKTTPGLRLLEKYAVRCGGGCSHRFGLYDAVLIKDNHISGLTPDGLAERVSQAAAGARAQGGALRFVQVEVDTLDQLDRVLALPAGVIDMVLLDNMPAPMLREACARRDRASCTVLLEASGGVTLDTVGEIARTGVDRISVGGLTHQALSLDFGLDAE